jgi:hypothetical protein
MMRSILLLLATLPLLLHAQVPQALEFQGIARDANANVLSSQNIALRLSVISGSPNGPVVYQETHATTTSAVGLFTVQIGTGGVQQGSFSAIGWAGSAHYLRVEYDATGGNTYLNMGTTQFLSVPYAFVSGTTVNCFSVSFSGDTLHQGNGCYVIIPGISAANGGCADVDGDGYFNQPGCGTPVDCNDMNATVNPGAAELCDGLDNNCNGQVDEGVSVLTDPLNCGACGNVCGPYPNATAACVSGTCTITCDPFYADCDNDPSNGCETFLGGTGNCGECGLVCPPWPNATVQCDMANCVYTCLPGYFDCNNDPSDGCETNILISNNHCGGCNITCPDGFTCQNGQCIQLCLDQDADGWTTCDGDCNDSDPNINPGVPELCDGVDNDCNGMVDEGLGTLTCGTGACQTTIPACLNGQEQICIPVTPTAEICGNGIDDDCDGLVDENCTGSCTDGILNGTETGVDCGGPTCPPCPAGQGCSTMSDCGPGLICQGGICVEGCPPAGTACDDGDPCTVNDTQNGSCQCIGMPLVCDDGNPCTTDICQNGTCVFMVAPNGTACPGGVCNNGTCVTSCPPGTTNCGGTCVDLSTSSQNCGACGNTCPPGQTCVNGLCTLVSCPDADNDGYTTCEGDCNDSNSSIFPGAPEVCDGMDNDCDGLVDEGVLCSLPNATTACQSGSCTIITCLTGFANCDGITANGCETALGNDNSNCGACGIVCPAGMICSNGQCIIQSCPDADNDGFTTCDGDCDDQNAAINPGEAEICDGIDNNCNGQVDEGFDADGDGYTSCGGDCNDQNAAIHPDAVEFCDGVDNNCNGQIDEGLGTITCGTGACQVTIPACVNGVEQGCIPGTPTTEICGNGIDDDCDGLVDENCTGSCTDGILNGQETGVDCGGPTCPPCPAGQGCSTTSDCGPGLICQGGICVP